MHSAELGTETHATKSNCAHRGCVAWNAVYLVASWSEYGATPATTRHVAPLRVRDAIRRVAHVGRALDAPRTDGIECWQFDSIHAGNRDQE